MRETSSGAAPLGVTGVLSAWLAETTLDQVPVRVRERAKHLPLDGIGCALVGALIGWGGRATSAARFVVTTGGEYLFMPGIRALRWLAHLPEHQP